MEKRNSNVGSRGGRSERNEKQTVSRARKKSEYGRQLEEKQKVKEMYGLRERQFRRFFGLALRSKEATGERLLSLLESRLDNVVFRLKFASSREQARQIVVHGHVMVNGVKVSAPSYLVSVSDVVSLSPALESKTAFLETVIEKRLNSNAKVPDWLELDKKARKGNVLRQPVRDDIQAPIEEHLIVELYSK
jgi:small subunit ribosomal protein S4